MLTKDAQIKLLEKKVAKLETQMLFVIEMIGAPDAKAYEKGLQKTVKKQDKELTSHYKKLGWPITV